MTTRPRLLVLIARRPELTPDRYKYHYENVHMPLPRRLLGNAVTSQERNCIPYSADGSVQALIGSDGLAYDCITISVFSDGKESSAYSGRV